MLGDLGDADPERWVHRDLARLLGIGERCGEGSQSVAQRVLGERLSGALAARGALHGEIAQPCVDMSRLEALEQDAVEARSEDVLLDDRPRLSRVAMAAC